MESVFKYFNVYEDIAEIIAFKVHYSFQTEINKRIEVLVDFDWNYNYWAGTQNMREIPNIHLYKWSDRLYGLDNDKLSIQEYSYMCNKHDVFSMIKKVRLNNYLEKTKMRYDEVLNDKLYELKDTMSRKCFNNNPAGIQWMKSDIMKVKHEYTRWLYSYKNIIKILKFKY